MSWTGSFQPAYKVEFWSGSTLLHGFGSDYTNQISSFRVKPGLTAAIGSFEIVIPDTGSSATGVSTGRAFKNIEVYDTVKIWYGYTGSGTTLTASPKFAGKIDTKNVDFSDNGCIRTFVGRDYGEALFRILERRGFTGSAYTTIVTLKDDAGLYYSNANIDATNEIYPITLINDNCFKGLKEVVDLDNRDFYTDAYLYLHAFERQSLTDTESSFVENTNILSYRLFKDLTEVYNQYYVFGMRDPSNITGSDIPVNHDDWTEQDLSNWTALIYSGSNSGSLTVAYSTGYKATGSASITVEWRDTGSSVPGTFLVHLRRTFNPIYLLPDDILHLYYHTDLGTTAGANDYYKFRLGCGSWDNYFETTFEGTAQSTSWQEKTVQLSPLYEGISFTGSTGTNTGSYKWLRIGSPDWFNVDRIELIGSYFGMLQGGAFAYTRIDGLYFGTRFQAYTSSAISTGSYGARPKVVMDERYNSTPYCVNVGNTLLAENSTPTTQIEVNTIGQPKLIMGKKYLLNILSENINNYYELIDLEQRWENDSFLSKGLLTNKKQMRIPIPLINYPVQVVAKEKSLIDRISERPWRH